ncbi:MAG: gfo/Idh/MocA family oxidoreductase, partial [Pirellula sp.]
VVETWKRTAEHLQANEVKDYSIWMGKQLSIDPIGEVFTGSDAPNEWLTREYRAPYSLPSEQAV